MGMSQFYSPLRYPGGKRKLANYISNLITLNQLEDCTYVEAFAGGSSIALSLLFEQYAKKIYINDYDPAVFNFWKSVVHDTDDFCRLITDTQINMDNWRKQKSILNDENSSILESGFALFFLNRTNRSGIIKAGVIGGKNQNGNYKMDCRFNKVDLIQRIKKIARHKSHIEITNYDAKKLLKKVVEKLDQNSLVYLDPPYYVKGGDLYAHNFQHQDHLKLANAVAKLNHNWVVSYDYVEPIDEMYDQFRRIYYGISYTVQEKYEGSELMVFSDDLDIIDEGNPTKSKKASAKQLSIFKY